MPGRRPLSICSDGSLVGGVRWMELDLHAPLCSSHRAHGRQPARDVPRTPWPVGPQDAPAEVFGCAVLRGELELQNDVPLRDGGARRRPAEADMMLAVHGLRV